MLKKILFLVTQSEFGGAQRFIFELVKNLNNQNYEFFVAAGEGDEKFFKKLSELKTKNSKLQLNIQKLKNLKRVPTPYHTIKAMAEIVRLLKKEKPDILFLCSTTAGILGSIASRIYKLQTSNYELRTIYRIGGWAFRDPRPFFLNWLIFLAEKLTAPLKDKIIVNSEIDRQLAIKYKICPAEKIVKIYNGIDINELKFFLKEKAKKELFKRFEHFEQLEHQTIIGTVANFYKTKGLPYLIEAFNILITGVKLPTSNIKLFIIGEGNERPKLEKLIKKYHLKNQVFLLGKIPDAYKYLKAFDIFVLPSLKEGFPWIILEAMAAEIPIVATKVGAIPEIIENKKEGILIEPKNSQILAEKIFWLLNHQKEAKEMVLKAKEKLKEFNLEKMIKETEELLAAD